LLHFTCVCDAKFLSSTEACFELAACAFEEKIMRMQDAKIYLHFLFGVIVAGLLMCSAGCGRSSGESPTKFPNASEPLDPAVHYVKVAEQTLPETLDLAAKVQADPTKVVRIFPPASGRVVAIEVKPGEYVRRGETVAILNSSDVASARSDYAKANIEADRAGRAMERQKLLFEHGAAAEKDYIDSRAQAESARAELARARQRLELLNVNPKDSSDQVSLMSPANGVVLDVGAASGEFSKSLESANPLITIADLNPVWMVGDVYEKDVAKIHRGEPVTITLQAYPGEKLSGRVDSISGALDPATRTLKVRIVLPNPGERLKPEMFGAIHVNTGVRRALVVPATAIIREGDATTVFVNSGGNPEQRVIVVGQTVEGKVEVLSGLRSGEEVAAQGAELLKEAAK
jgi:membrane fusion protein, heavy metal efflux system